MPKWKSCQHPTLHTGSSYVAAAPRRISTRILTFIVNRYGCEELNTHWLCSKCRSVETKVMKKQHEMGRDDMDISGEELSKNSSMDNEGEGDDNDERSEDKMLLEPLIMKNKQ